LSRINLNKKARYALKFKIIQTAGYATALLFTGVFCNGCQTAVPLMETPNIYAGKTDAYADVPEQLRSPEVRVLYGTDRAPLKDKAGEVVSPLELTYQRSHALSVGFATVRLDDSATWEELVDASLTQTRKRNFYPEMTGIEPKIEWPASNFRYGASPNNEMELEIYPDVLAGETSGQENLCELVSGYGGVEGPQEVFLFIHGYNTDFEYASVTMAQVWHFLERKGIPAVFSWPAGRGGARGYMFDRESGEFAIFHLKQFIRALAACDKVSKINIIAHSRGTDVALTTLRELHLESGGDGKGTREKFKLSHVILAAPDLDMQVIAQRVAAEGLYGVPEHMIVYLCPDDRAILLATWIFNSVKRIGMLKYSDMNSMQTNGLEQMRRLEVIQADVKRVDFIGHGYFYSHPAVSSDLILLLKDNKGIGSANGRPLEQHNGMYVLKPGYPEFDIEQK